MVLVWALDRLTHEGVAETFDYFKRLASHGVQFVSFTEGHFRTTGPAAASGIRGRTARRTGFAIFYAGGSVSAFGIGR